MIGERLFGSDSLTGKEQPAFVLPLFGLVFITDGFGFVSQRKEFKREYRTTMKAHNRV